MNQYVVDRWCRISLLAVLMIGLSSTAMAAEKHYTVTAPDGVRLAVQESGDPNGPTIVFIHGLLGSRLDWAQQIHAPELQRYRMITYDLRGHGLSDKPEDPDAYRDGQRYADDLNAVLRATDAMRPVLVGWSLGGTVISNYLAAFGDTHVSGALYVGGVVELTPTLITAHPEVYAGMASDDLETHLDAVRTFLGLCFHTQPDQETLERLLSNAAMASWLMTRVTPAMSVQAEKGLSRATVPIMLLYGSQDALINVVPSVARAKALNPSIQTILYADAGHAPFLEEATRFSRNVAEFVQSVLHE